MPHFKAWKKNSEPFMSSLLANPNAFNSSYFPYSYHNRKNSTNFSETPKKVKTALSYFKRNIGLQKHSVPDGRKRTNKQ